MLPICMHHPPRATLQLASTRSISSSAYANRLTRPFFPVPLCDAHCSTGRGRNRLVRVLRSSGTPHASDLHHPPQNLSSLSLYTVQ